MSLTPPAVQLTNIDVNETVEGDERAFEIWHEREDSVRKYTLQARTVILKNSWLRELRNLQQRYSMPAWSEYLTSHLLAFPSEQFTRTRMVVTLRPLIKNVCSFCYMIFPIRKCLMFMEGVHHQFLDS